MIPIVTNDDATRAKYELECSLLAGEVRQLFAGETLLTTLARDSYELSVEWGKLIFAWWDEKHSQNWRIVAYEIGQAEVRLEVTRGVTREATNLILRDAEKWREAREIETLGLTERRRHYARLLTGLLKSKYTNVRVQRATTGAERAHAAPGRFARLSLRLNEEVILAIGVNEAESTADIESIIAAGLIWLANFNESREARLQAKRLWFCLPRERSLTAIERLTLIDVSHLGASIECYEIDERREELIAVRPVTQDELLNSHPRELRWPERSNTSARWRERILSLAPGLVEVRHREDRDGESLAINGLEFARVIAGEERQVKFGVAGSRNKDTSSLVTLDESNFNDLERLLSEIVRYRSSDSPDRRHPFYRLRTEAWLESMLRRDIHALDTSLDERFVYSQIPTWRADERSVIDLLTVNHENRLVVIEIKAAEDPQLPLQGLDYWLRVEQARLRREFEKRGIFAGIKIASQPALLYLVAPRLRFHRTFVMVARCIAPQIETYQIGVNLNWREGIHVHSRERINSH
ncbi:MAG: hypothetical protein MOB07_03910 [Acidobacteria bacterium]|nr:hypothetical protein [Acidobacteriota bacterium]